MTEKAKELNQSGRIFISSPTEYGAQVVASDPPLESVAFVTPKSEPPPKKQKN